jgi:hypothetical protein
MEPWSKPPGAVQEAMLLPPAKAGALHALALLELRRGRPSEALARADEGAAVRTMEWPSLESVARLTRAEALRALGRTEDSLTAIRDARDRILRIADALADEASRDRYLRNIKSNARTLALAKEWLGEG